MRRYAEIWATIEKSIQDILLEDHGQCAPLNGDESLTDLGLDSLLLARLVLELDEKLAVEPFNGETLSIVDVRTVSDLVGAYHQTFGPALSKSA